VSRKRTGKEEENNRKIRKGKGKKRCKIMGGKRE